MEKGKLAYLETNQKFVVVESSGYRPEAKQTIRMVAKSAQKNHISKSLTVNVIYDYELQCMAFGFKHQNEDRYPVVIGDNIEFEEKLTSDKKFWFQWVEQTGDWRTVRSMARPDMYLYTSKNNNVICSRQSSHFRIRFTEDMARYPDKRISYLPLCPSTRYNGKSAYQMVVHSFNISDNGNSSEESSHKEIIQHKMPIYPNTRYRKDMSFVENLTISDNKNSSDECRPEMIHKSELTYLKTRRRKYMWVQSKDRSTSQMVKISANRNPSQGEQEDSISISEATE